MRLPRIVFVTGTGTEIGKTIATAALAARLLANGLHVEMAKPTQTGLLPGEAGDCADVARLTGGIATHEHVRLADPLAPDAAARVAGASIPTLDEHARWIAGISQGSLDHLLVEGAGGLLVRLDQDGSTFADLIVATRQAGLDVGVVVVVAPGLGTLNHAALTVEALRARDIEPDGLVIGSWPDDPDLATRCNAKDLPEVTRVPLLATIPEQVGGWTSERFLATAPDWFADC